MAMENHLESQEMETHFAYSPMKEGEIRLLCVSSVQHDEQSANVPEVRCTLQHFKAMAAPPYYALSYVWGDSSYRKLIRMNGARFYVTQNLFDALLQIHDRTSELLGYLKAADIEFIQPQLYFWIDAACLNQEDIAEKSKNIPKIGQVYREAFNVMVWLGELTLKDARMDLDSLEINDSMDHQPNWDALRIKLTDHGTNIVSLHWFTRVWVIQECGLAQREPLFYHSQGQENMRKLYLSLNKVKPLEDASWTLDPRRKSYYLVFNIIQQRLLSSLVSFRPSAFEHLSPMERLEYLVLQKGLRNCALEHDNIYALLGLIGASNLPRELDPDYSKPFSDVAEAYTRHVFLETRRLALLGNTHLKASPNTPSWVSDFRPLYQLPPTDTAVRAVRQKNIQFASNNKELLVDGIVVGKVQDWTPAPSMDGDQGELMQSLRYLHDKLLGHIASTVNHADAHAQTWQNVLLVFMNALGYVPQSRALSDFLLAENLLAPNLYTQNLLAENLLAENILAEKDPSQPDQGVISSILSTFFPYYGYLVLDKGDLLFYWPQNLVWGEAEYLAVMFVGAISMTILEKLEDGKYRCVAQAQPFPRLWIPPRMYEPPEEYFETNTLQRFTLV